jgi:hypothetical protein
MLETSELIPAVLVGLKTAIILLMLVYLVFAVILVKQVRLMTDTLKVGFEAPVRMFAYLHFLFAFVVLLYALFL